ncbi:MAG: N-acetylmuramic acid 6-phosphate etherase [Paracoccaceae bacterium]|nr:N-acetylmuramic acid 6-phosphate etherase [Paracoccaceae bacterium]
MTSARTEELHPASAGLHGLSSGDVLLRLLDAQLASAQCLYPCIPAIAQAVDVAARRYGVGGRLIYAGAGSSGLMALADCLELSGTYGIAPARTPMLFAGGVASLSDLRGDVEDVAANGVNDLARVDPTPRDVVICVSASGATPYTVAIAEAARRAGASVVGIANVADSALLALADVAILLDTGPELIAGSTRMAAATAQKIALNMFSTCLGVRLGHVHDGFMVNLRAENTKLQRRAARLVAAIAGCDEGSAIEALGLTDGEVKPAILVAQGASRVEAADLLKVSGGHLAPALAARTTRKS